MDALLKADEGIHVVEATGAGVQLSNWYGLRAETLYCWALSARRRRRRPRCTATKLEIFISRHASTPLQPGFGTTMPESAHAQLASKRCLWHGESVTTLLIRRTGMENV
jgi:hypothetical protein